MLKKLDAEEINQAYQRFAQQKWQGDITIHEEVDSTNSWLSVHGKHLDVCLSEFQTSGKGRGGNAWHSSENGNIYFSLKYQFNTSIDYWSLLSLAVGISVCETINGLLGSSENVNLGIKWPNDILINNQKVSGILLESNIAKNTVVIGIGVNVMLSNSTIESISQPVTSLQQHYVLNDDTRVKLVVDLMVSLTDMLHSFEHSILWEKWDQWDLLSGRDITYRKEEEIRQGLVIGFSNNGEIVLKDLDGRISSYSLLEIKKIRDNN